MPPQLIENIRRQLTNGVTEDAHAVYLMVEIRKLIDREEIKKSYPWLKLLCDWTVHTSIEHKHDAAGPLLTKFEEMIERERAEKGFSLEFLDYLSLSSFRHELHEFLSSRGLPLSITEEAAWNTFLNLLANVLSDCPVEYTASREELKLIEKLTLTKELPKDSYVLSLLADKPFSLWMNWKVRLKDGSCRDWPFYN